MELYRIYQEKITDCDLPLRKHLESFTSKLNLKTQPIGPRPKGKKNSRNAPSFDLRTELYRITGIDWTQINGIDVLTAQTVIAEAGADLSAFPNEKQFASWLGLCPTNEQSGGKILNRRTRKVVHRATVAFRNAAMTLVRSQSYLKPPDETSEHDLYCELQDAGVARTSQLAEPGIGQAGYRVAEVGPVEQVESLQAQLASASLAQERNL